MDMDVHIHIYGYGCNMDGERREGERAEGISIAECKM